MRFVYLIIALVSISCSDSISFFGSSVESTPRPSEEDEGIPGYLVDPEMLAAYKGQDGKVYVAINKDGLDKGKATSVHVVTYKHDKAPQAKSELKDNLNDANKLSIDAAGNALGAVEHSPEDDIAVIVIVGQDDAIAATYFSLNGESPEVSSMDPVADLCRVATFEKAVLDQIDNIIPDLIVKCGSEAAAINDLTERISEEACLDGEGASCRKIKRLPLAAACTEPLATNPEKIDCQIPMESADDATRFSAGLQGAKDKFAIKTAAWISVFGRGDPQIWQENGQDVEAFNCAAVSKDNRLVYVNSFSLSADTEVRVDAIIDDMGYLRIWQDGDSSKEVLLINDYHDVNDSAFMSREQYLTATKTLKKGHYTVVIDVIDTHNWGHQTVFNLHRTADKGVILETQADSGWCVFDIEQNVDIATFLQKSATCLKCYNGRLSY